MVNTCMTLIQKCKALASRLHLPMLPMDPFNLGNGFMNRLDSQRSELRPIYFDLTWHIQRFPNFFSPDQVQEIQCLLKA